MDGDIVNRNRLFIQQLSRNRPVFILHLVEGRLMLRETLAVLEKRLGTTSFARVNRSALVHLDQIKELQPTFHGDFVVVLRNGTTVPLSRSLRGQFAKFTGENLG